MHDTRREPLILFFDLDGTLSNPSDGITRCIQYALERLGRPCPPKSELTQFIGPPLRYTFPRLLGTGEPALIEKAVAHYRERYGDVGLFENEVYPGIPEVLAQLHGAGHRLYVVTSKPTVYADRIIAHFGFDRFLRDVFGPTLDGRFDEKSELIEFILRELSPDPKRTVMIGDRARDIESGKTHGLGTIGVIYGFGSRGEIEDARPDEVCTCPGDICPAVLRFRNPA